MYSRAAMIVLVVAVIAGGVALDMHMAPQRSGIIREIEATIESVVRPDAPAWISVGCYLKVSEKHFRSQQECLSASWHQGTF